MTGIVFSNVLLPVMPAILQSGTIYLSTNTGPENYAGAGCNPNFFAVAWQNEDIPAAMGKYAADQGYKRVALIAPDYPGGRESLNGFKRLYKGGLSEEIYTQLGQLDYGVEITRLRASKPDAVFFFLPGGMGVNFIKQFNGAGLGQEIALLAPGFRATRTPSPPWASRSGPAQHRAMGGGPGQSRQPQVRRGFQEDLQAHADAVRLAGLRRRHAAGQRGAPDRRQLDADTLRPALRRADFKSVRGDFKFNRNQYPIQNYYLRIIEAGADGKPANKLSGTVLTQYQDPFAASCQME